MKIYKRVQKIIQDTYLLMFFSWSYILVLLLIFRGTSNLKNLIIGVAISGTLSIGKFITHYRKNPAKAKKEIQELFRSERG